LQILGPSILKSYVYGLSIAGIAGSNIAESMDIGLLCVILGFLSDVGEICALLGYFAAYNGNSLPTFRNRYPETSVGNYHYTCVITQTAEISSLVVFVVCCIDNGFCDELITRPEESFWLCLCDLATLTMGLPRPETR
jgi:hypothetical protein